MMGSKPSAGRFFIVTNLPRAAHCALLLFCLVLGGFGETKKLANNGDLLLSLRPVKPVFELGTDITMEFTFKNVSRHRVLATRGAGLDDFTLLEVTDERGRRVNWQGVLPVRGYPKDFFVILGPGQSVTFQEAISYSYEGRRRRGLGAAYQIERPGAYRVQAAFSLAPKAYFGPVSDGAAVPERLVFSNWAHFSVVKKVPERTGR
jgi:hypothetical protein